MSLNGTAPVGGLLRDWRHKRRLSQLDLASQSGVSSRHLSFIETGRSKPSREMVVHLAEELGVPLRERNALLLAAGYAPEYRETDLDAAEMAPVREAIAQVLRGHEPFPAVVVDRQWNLVEGNRAIAVFVDAIDPDLLRPPLNVIRATLHPRGLSQHIVNYAEYREHLLTRLRRELLVTGDDRLRQLHDEVAAYPAPPGVSPLAETITDRARAVVMPLQLRTAEGVLSFFSTIATFGTPVDITIEELAIEAFFPADADTSELLQRRLGEAI